MNWKQAVVLIIVLLIVFGVIYALSTDRKKTDDKVPNSTESNTGSGGIGKTYCTQEVKECPDGSFVGRDPSLNCAYRQCP